MVITLLEIALRNGVRMAVASPRRARETGKVPEGDRGRMMRA
jgi:hypothetical protein